MSSKEEKEFLDEGMNYLKIGELERAEEIFKDFLVQYPNSDLADNACYNIAKIHQKKGNLTKAIAWLEYLLKHYPDSDAAYFASDEKEELESQLANKTLDSPEALFKRAKTAFDHGDLNGAEQAFLTFLQNFPNSSLADNALYNLIVIYRKQKRDKEANEYLSRLLRDYPNTDAAIMARYLAGESE